MLDRTLLYLFRGRRVVADMKYMKECRRARLAAGQDRRWLVALTSISPPAAIIKESNWKLFIICHLIFHNRAGMRTKIQNYASDQIRRAYMFSKCWLVHKPCPWRTPPVRDAAPGTYPEGARGWEQTAVLKLIRRAQHPESLAVVVVIVVLEVRRKRSNIKMIMMGKEENDEDGGVGEGRIR